MKKAQINGVELEYRSEGTGEPVLLIGTGPVADSFLPFFSQEAMAGRYRLITYRQRQMSVTNGGRAPVTYEQHASDAAALLDHLGVVHAHLVGHSTGAVIAIQVAVDHPDLVDTMALLEPTLVGAPEAAAFLPSIPAVIEAVGPAFVRYGAGQREEAMMMFLCVVSGLDRDLCRTAIERQVPGGVAQAMRDADQWFSSYLPALGLWRFGSEQAASISQPVLSVLGTESGPLFEEANALLHHWFPQTEDCVIEGVGHLLLLQRPEPVAQGVAEFLAQHAATSPAESATTARARSGT